MRILIVTYQGHMQGSTNSIAYLAKGLAERGHEVYMGLREGTILWDLLDDSRVQRVPMVFKGKFDRANWRRIRDIVKEHDIQLINAQSSYDRYGSIFANWVYKLGVKVIHTRRQRPFSMGVPLQLYLYNRRTDGIVAVSRPVKEQLVRLGIREDHVKVIHNGTPASKYEKIDPQVVSELMDKFDIREGDLVIGCISRIKEQIQILRALNRIETPVKMIFCGIEANNEMKEVVAGYKTPHKVFFEGAVDVEKVLNYYKLFTIKVMASTNEGLSQSLLESMALGVPVIATAMAGNLDLVQDEENGLLFVNDNIPELSSKINRLLSDPVLRNKFSEAGKVTALQTFNIENTISKYEKYFEEMTGSVKDRY